MTQDILQKVKDDIQFLLNLAPASNPDDVEPGLAPMFYITGTYDGDVKLIGKIKEIKDRYNIQEMAPEDEDFEGVE